jgi:hypothetical protein
MQIIQMSARLSFPDQGDFIPMGPCTVKEGSVYRQKPATRIPAGLTQLNKDVRTAQQYSSPFAYGSRIRRTNRNFPAGFTEKVKIAAEPHD